MFSYISLGVRNFDQAFGLYSAVMGSLGLKLRFCEGDTRTATNSA